MIRRHWTEESAIFWRKRAAEKQALNKKNLIQGCFLAVGLFAMPFVILCLMILMTGKAHATGLADLKFGQAQIADSQWNTGACLYTTTCEIYSKNPGTAYKVPWWSGQISWASGDYVAFTATGNTTNPWNAIQYTSNGTMKDVIGTGHIINMGPNYFFFVGNDNDTGQLFSMTKGFVDSGGVTWTGTLNPSVQQVNDYAVNGSTTPLAAGQSASAGPPPPPPPPPFDGTIMQANAPGNQTIGSGASYVAPSDASDKQSRINTWNNSTQTYNNMLYIDQVGQSNTVTVTQTGTKNKIDMSIIGNGNNITDNQTGSNYLKIDVPGWGNMITTTQTNSTGSNYAETKIQGNGNTVNHTQNGNGNQVLFSKIAGDINTVNASQSGQGGHVADVTLTGNWNSATIGQTGNTGNKATIDLTNAGGPASVDLQQSGGKSFTIIQGCTNPAGCTTVVRQ
jgi:hypothetical protein